MRSKGSEGLLQVTRSVALVLVEGEVLVGTAGGRRSDDDITVFDAHGLALHDLVCGMHVLREAARRGLGQAVDWPHTPGQD